MMLTSHDKAYINARLSYDDPDTPIESGDRIGDEKEVNMDTFEDLEGYTSGNYIKLENEKPITAIFRGFAIEDDPFAKKAGEKRVAYFLEIAGEGKTLTSKSKRLANKIMELKPKDGDTITIERIGLGFDTDFNVEIVK